MEDIKINAQKYQKELYCPIHNCLIGKYDVRTGLINTTFYCPKCKFEYTFTIKPSKDMKKP